MASVSLNNKTKELLLDGLFELMNDKPLEKISVKEIAQTCQISRRTFYYHFDDVYDALGWYFKQILSKLVSDSDKEGEPRTFSDFLLKFTDYICENRTIIEKIYASSQGWRIRDMFYKYTSDYFCSYLKSRPELNSFPTESLENLSNCCIISVSALIQEWFVGNLKVSRDQLLSLFSDSENNVEHMVLHMLKKLS